jgi:hypothetical protein
MSTKRALLIGIDTYPHVRRLCGCVNDVRLMHSVLVSTFGFPEEHITLLTNEQATRDAMLGALDALVDATEADDIVVIHYAGHGSQMRDREGDEPSGFDSTLMPWDTARAPGENRDITDDEIHLKLAALAAKTPFTTIVVDACHSGTITRDAFGARTRSVEPDLRPASELPPSPIPQGQLMLTRSGASGWMPLDDKYVLIAGCRDDEESTEYAPPEGGGSHGALTYFLCQQLRRSISGTTYRDVFETAAAKVNAYNTAQHPQIEGTADREVFGVKELVPSSFVPVTERNGMGVTLGAGAAHGLTVGSTYDVYPPGTKDPAAGTALGELTISAVRPFTAGARVTRERAPGSVAVGARAFESAHAFGDLTMKVEVVAPVEAAASTLREGIGASARLTIVASHVGAAVRIYLLPARTAVSPGEPVPQAGALDRPMWAAVGAAGDLVMPLEAMGDEATVVRNLEAIARCHRVHATDNTDPRSRLNGKVSLEILRGDGAGQWVTAVPEKDGGQAVFEDHEPIAFRVTSQHDRDLHVALVNVGPTGDVGVVFQERLGAKTQFLQEADVSLPDGYPFVDLADQVRGGEGRETMKLFVTEEDVDFRGLEQEGVRSAERASSPLASLLKDTVAATPTRNVKPKAVAGADWTTVTRTFTVRRRTAGLPAAGGRVAIGTAFVSATGLSGTVTTAIGKDGRDETAGLATGALQRALADAGVTMRPMVSIEGARGLVSTTRGPGEGPEIEVQLPPPPEGYGQMVLAADELGVLSWSFADRNAATRGGDGPSARRTYRIPGAVPEHTAVQPGSRGVIGVVGKKILTELVFPLVSPALGEVGAALVRRLEATHWPYRVRSFTPDDYTNERAPAIDADGWSRMRGRRALLMVHGTFSRTHLAFGQLPRDYVEALFRHYEGRVFAFDHPFLSEDPAANARWLVSHVPADAAMTVDIVCHSRGGLVSRVLSEKRAELPGSERLQVGKVVLVGVPNAGTALADPEHVGTLFDVFTNLINFVPDSFGVPALTMLVECAKAVAVGALDGLAGLRSMRPNGEFETWLNHPGRALSQTRYFAVASKVTPTEPGLKHLAFSRGLDRLLRGANDFVVPTEGVFGTNGSSFFPVATPLVLEGAGAVGHTKYFADAGVRGRILDWLIS